MVFSALGFQLLLAGLVIWITGLEKGLTAMNNEMLILPTGLSKILGITTHLGIPLQLPVWIICFGGGLTLVSLLVFFLNRRIRKAARRQVP